MDNVPNVLSILPSTLPNLQTVKLYFLLLHDIIEPAFPRCPRLQAVELHQYNELLLHEIDCAYVSELTLGTELIPIAKGMEVLCKFCNIRRLTVRPTDIIIDPSFKPRTVLFPYLHSLELYGESAAELFRGLKMPTLKEVKFYQGLSLTLFEDASCAPNVETVHVCLRQHNATDRNFKKIKRLPTVVPLLRRLVVPRWWSYVEEESYGLSLEEDWGVQLEFWVDYWS